MDNFVNYFWGFVGVCLIVAAYLWAGASLKAWFNALRYKLLKGSEQDNPYIEVLKEPSAPNDGSGAQGMRIIIAQKNSSKTFPKSDWEEKIDSSLGYFYTNEKFKRQYHCAVKTGAPLGIYRIQYRRLPEYALRVWCDKYDPQRTAFDMDFSRWETSFLIGWVEIKVYVLFDKSTPFDDETDVVYEDIPKVKL